MTRPLSILLLLLLAGALGCRHEESPSREKKTAKDNPLRVAVATSPSATATPAPPRKVTTPEGVAIEFQKETAALPPRPGEKVWFRYKAMLADGRIVDETPAGQEYSAVIGESRLIRGMELALAQMPTGSHAIVTVPASLAYGDKEIGEGALAPGSDLKFDIELTRTTPAPAPTK